MAQYTIGDTIFGLLAGFRVGEDAPRAGRAEDQGEVQVEGRIKGSAGREGAENVSMFVNVPGETVFGRPGSVEQPMEKLNLEEISA